MRDDDLEERLRRALHVQLDIAEPTTTDRPPRARRGVSGPFGLLAAATSIVLVAVLVGPRLAGPGGTSPGGSSGPFPAGTSSAEVAGSEAPGTGGASASTSGSIPSTTGSAGGPGPGPNLTAMSPAPTRTQPLDATLPPTPAETRGPAPTASRKPAPTRTPWATPTAASAVVVVTLADAGQTVDLAVGQRLVLQLGATYQWTVQVSGSGVLAPASVPSQADQQGTWIAERTGTAQLQVVGNPYCLHSKPPCAMPSRAFTVTVIVR